MVINQVPGVSGVPGAPPAVYNARAARALINRISDQKVSSDGRKGAIERFIANQASVQGDEIALLRTALERARSVAELTTFADQALALLLPAAAPVPPGAGTPPNAPPPPQAEPITPPMPQPDPGTTVINPQDLAARLTLVDQTHQADDAGIIADLNALNTHPLAVASLALIGRLVTRLEASAATLTQGHPADVLGQEFSRLTDQMKTLRDQYDALEKTITDLERQSTVKGASIDQLEAQIPQAADDQETQDGLKRLLSRAQTKRTEIERDIEQRTTERTSLIEQMALATVLGDSLREQLADSRDSLDRKIEMLDDNMGFLHELPNVTVKAAEIKSAPPVQPTPPAPPAQPPAQPAPSAPPVLPTPPAGAPQPGAIDPVAAILADVSLDAMAKAERLTAIARDPAQPTAVAQAAQAAIASLASSVFKLSGTS